LKAFQNKGVTMETAFKEITSLAIKNLSITVVYDNNIYKKGLATSWGFACVVKRAEKTILFDTGGNSAVLLNNMHQLEDIIANFRALGVAKVGPCYCTGELASRTFKKEYGNDYLNVGVGRLIDFE
jgi:metal-dependent hydrolase (beta-lactamase superfamily II)